MNIGLIGTGLMGEPMGMNLLKAGYPLAAYNRTQSKTRNLEKAGAVIAGSVGGVCDAAKVIVIMLLHKPAIDGMLDGMLTPGRLSGKTIIQMSTIAPEESRDLGAQIESAGGRYLEAPVLGSTPQATDAKLVILAGGDKKLYESMKDILDAMGAPKHIGDIGEAAAMKLAMNQMIASFTAGFALSYAYAKSHGIDEETFLGAFSSGPLHVPLLDYKIPLMQKGEYTPPFFPAVHLLKDVDLFLGSLPGSVDASMLEAVKGLLERTGEKDADGDDRRDFAALFDTIMNG